MSKNLFVTILVKEKQKMGKSCFFRFTIFVEMFIQGNQQLHFQGHLNEIAKILEPTYMFYLNNHKKFFVPNKIFLLGTSFLHINLMAKHFVGMNNLSIEIELFSH